MNLERLIRKGDATQNIQIQNRDIIFVPRYAIYTINQWVGAYSALITSGLLPLTVVQQIRSLTQ